MIGAVAEHDKGQDKTYASSDGPDTTLAAIVERGRVCNVHKGSEDHCTRTCNGCRLKRLGEKHVIGGE
jgi:hypothetical protein